MCGEGMYGLKPVPFTLCFLSYPTLRKEREGWGNLLWRAEACSLHVVSHLFVRHGERKGWGSPGARGFS